LKPSIARIRERQRGARKPGEASRLVGWPSHPGRLVKWTHRIIAIEAIIIIASTIYFLPPAVFLVIIPYSIEFQRLVCRFLKEFIKRELFLGTRRGSQLLLQTVQRFECSHLPHGQKLQVGQRQGGRLAQFKE
jgi:hypothetical protein